MKVYRIRGKIVFFRGRKAQFSPVGIVLYQFLDGGIARHGHANHVRRGVESLLAFGQNREILQSMVTTFAFTLQGSRHPALGMLW
jgi:hypothetical protein